MNSTLILSIINIIIGTSFISVFLYLILRVVKQLINMKYIKSFVDYTAVLEHNMNKAYDIIYKDRVLVYSLDAQRVRDEEFAIISNDFAKLLIKMIGPMMYSEFIKLYGNEETFIFNLIEYFNTRYEDDEIRKQSLDSIADENHQDAG